jgi:hypothetical protein
MNEVVVSRIVPRENGEVYQTVVEGSSSGLPVLLLIPRKLRICLILAELPGRDSVEKHLVDFGVGSTPVL